MRVNVRWSNDFVPNVEEDNKNLKVKAKNKNSFYIFSVPFFWDIIKKKT